MDAAAAPASDRKPSVEAEPADAKAERVSQALRTTATAPSDPYPLAADPNNPAFDITDDMKRIGEFKKKWGWQA
jgi:hypothetical protein